MKSKVLIIGGLPMPQEGPWVDISDGEEWGVLSLIDYGENAVVEVEPPVPSVRHPIRKGWTRFDGERARVVVVNDVEHLVANVTVEIVCLKKANVSLQSG